MIVLRVPTVVKRFFAPVRPRLSKPIRAALPAMVLALLLGSHRRSLKTIGKTVVGQVRHGGTISRRLSNPHWQTHNWYKELYEFFSSETDRWERRVAEKGKKRRWTIVLDGTCHGTLSEDMENLVLMSRRKNPARRNTRQHIFLMGMLLTDRGGRIPLPRKSYYTKEYCRKHHRRYRTLVELAAEMLKEVRVPEDVDVTVVFDSAFDAGAIHRIARRRGFRAVFPIDPNRVLASEEHPEAAGLPGQKVVAWTRTWDREEFELIELQEETEDHVFQRRRHADNLKAKKTKRRYAVAARRAAVSKLGTCLIVASYKENPKIELQPGQSAQWWAYHTPEVPHRKKTRSQPARWHGKVLACTDTGVTPRQVIEWLEVRWQVELLFRELKSRMQFGRYVLMKFEAVERYLDLMLMGFLFLEQQRLHDMQRAGAQKGKAWVQARTTDRIRALELLCHEWNIDQIERRTRTDRGRRNLIADIRKAATAFLSM